MSPMVSTSSAGSSNQMMRVVSAATVVYIVGMLLFSIFAVGVVDGQLTNDEPSTEARAELDTEVQELLAFLGDFVAAGDLQGERAFTSGFKRPEELNPLPQSIDPSQCATYCVHISPATWSWLGECSTCTATDLTDYASMAVASNTERSNAIRMARDSCPDWCTDLNMIAQFFPQCSSCAELEALLAKPPQFLRQ